jgi:hypothetical protein
MEVQMEDENTAHPYKFTDLCREIMSMTIPGMDPAPDQQKAYVFDVIIPILGGYNGAAPPLPTALITPTHTS